MIFNKVLAASGRERERKKGKIRGGQRREKPKPQVWNVCATRRSRRQWQVLRLWQSLIIEHVLANSLLKLVKFVGIYYGIFEVKFNYINLSLSTQPNVSVYSKYVCVCVTEWNSVRVSGFPSSWAGPFNLQIGVLYCLGIIHFLSSTWCNNIKLSTVNNS